MPPLDMEVVEPDMTVVEPDMAIPDMMGEPDMAMPDMTVDPCVNVTCAPRAPVCTVNTLTTYGNGVCRAGQCEYTEQTQNCATAGRVCQGGACVDPMCPGCEAPGTCTPNGCAYPTCQREGDRCDAGNGTAQGGFSCLRNTAENKDYCFRTCPADFSATGCGAGQYCLEVGGGANLNVCFDSECASDSDCGTGTCLKFDNNFGLCLQSGSVGVGATCNPSAGQRCQQGLVCDVPANAMSGTCVRLCDPWGSGGCTGNQLCGLYTNRAGTCTSNRDPIGMESFDVCQTAGSFCANATQCFGLSGGQSACFKYCRPGGTDCVEQGLPATSRVTTMCLREIAALGCVSRAALGNLRASAGRARIAIRGAGSVAGAARRRPIVALGGRV